MSIPPRHDFSDIAHRLRALREARQLSQADLGGMLEPPVSQATVSHWESGRKPLSLERVLELSAKARVPAAYFLGEIELDDATLRGDLSDRYVEATRGSVEVDLADDREVAVLPARGARHYDPDEPPIPQGLEELIESGMVMTGGELRELMGFVDPRARTGGANGSAWRWPAEEWLKRLMEARLEKWMGRLRERQKPEFRSQKSEDG